MKESLFDLHKRIEEKHWWFTARREIIRRVLVRIAPPSGDLTLVNVGCGTGADLFYLSRFYRSIGIDASSVAVTAAQTRSPDSLIILGSSAKALPYRQKGEKRVWLFLDVLEHIKDDAKFFAKFALDMAVGESVIITAPANPKIWSNHDVSFGHYRRYTKETLMNLWYGLPFAVQLLSYFNTRLYPLIWLMRTYNNKFEKTAEEETDFSVLPPLFNDLLHKIFYGEYKRLLDIINGGPPYKIGASLMAVLTRI